MSLEPEDLGVECLETNGFVPMLKCRDYSKGLKCHDPGCRYHDEISEVYKKLGLIKEVEDLPEDQQNTLYGIDCRDTHYPLQRDFLESGFRIAKKLISSDGKSLAFFAVRGSTSRGAAKEDEDVDLFGISEKPEKHLRYLNEICNEEGKLLKEKHPETIRSEMTLVAPFVIGDEYLDSFINDPLMIDMDPKFVETMYADTEGVYQMFGFLNNRFRNERILDNPRNNPFDFAKRVIMPGRKVFGLKEKDRTHNMVSLLTRLYGIQLHGDVPQFDITRLRDAYLFDTFKDVLSDQ